MIARDLLVASIPLLARVGCSGLKGWVSSEPHPGCAVYVGGIAVPDSPDVADPRCERRARRATVGGIAVHTYVEVSGRMTFGGHTAVTALAGYSTWF